MNVHDALAQVVFFNKIKRLMPELIKLEKQFNKLMKDHGPRPEYWPQKDQEQLQRLARLQEELQNTIGALDDLKHSVHTVLDKIHDLQGVQEQGVERIRELAEQEQAERLIHHRDMESARLSKREKFLKR